MRCTPLIAFTLAAATACGGSSSSGAAAASPAPAAGPDPCSSGACKVTVEMDETVGPQLNLKGAVYHVYAGCPRANGGMAVNDSTGIRSATPIMPAVGIPVISIPASLKGNTATISMWWGAVPHRYVVVDFSKGTTQVINYGYRWDGNKFYDDPGQLNINTRAERNICH